jgi:hypothetical protein
MVSNLQLMAVVVVVVDGHGGVTVCVCARARARHSLFVSLATTAMLRDCSPRLFTTAHWTTSLHESQICLFLLISTCARVSFPIRFLVQTARQHRTQCQQLRRMCLARTGCDEAQR